MKAGFYPTHCGYPSGLGPIAIPKRGRPGAQSCYRNAQAHAVGRLTGIFARRMVEALGA